MTAEGLRRSAARELVECLEFFGSAEGGDIGKLCWELQQKIVEVAKSEGWSAHPEWPRPFDGKPEPEQGDLGL